MYDPQNEAPWFIIITTYFSYLVLFLVGHLRDLFGKLFYPEYYRHYQEQNGYASLISDFESFYTRRIYYRIRECWNRPITGTAGRHLDVMERYITPSYDIKYTGKVKKVLNFSSYNYLGFAEAHGPCADSARDEIMASGVAYASPRVDAGSFAIHDELECLVAKFVDKESALVFPMGFFTNSGNIPGIISKGCLAISDSDNHTSIIMGLKLSNCQSKVFRHNDMANLEKVLVESIINGQPRTRRPWRKIIVFIEGLYSMEGSIPDLAAIIELKKKYKFYLFIDEAHSIGAIGSRGRGVCDYSNVSPNDVDILMGTFTKSFGAAGGYIASSKDLINELRKNSGSHVYGESFSPPVIRQIITSMKSISDDQEGKTRLLSIQRNSAFFSKELKSMGFITCGSIGSPVVPLLLFNPGKISAFSTEMMKRGIAVVVVGYPAVHMLAARVRFCISASHTMDDLTYALQTVSEVGDLLGLRLKPKESKKNILFSLSDQKLTEIH